MAWQSSKLAPTISITSQTLTNDTGVSATDGITNDGRFTLAGRMSGVTGTKVRIYDGSKFLGTATLDGNGGWTYSGTLPAGSHALHAVATDTSGRTATTTNQSTILVATLAPVISILSQTLAQDTGISATDRVTSNGAVTLAGSISGAAGTAVKIFDGNVQLGTATLDGKGGWSYATTLPIGTHTLHAVASDLAGNTTTTAAFPTITVETSIPVISINTQILAQDTGLSNTDLVTNNGAVTLSGTVSGAAGTFVEIRDGTAVLGLATLDGHGGWTYATTLTDGTHTLQAVATDLSGHSVTTPVQSAITVDHTVPVVSYRYENQVVGSNSVQLFGNYTGPAGTKIEVYSGTTDLGTATITGSNTWQFTTPVLTDGNYSFSAVATTLAGNTATFGGVPSLTVGAAVGTLNTANFTTVWRQDFTTAQIDRDIFPTVYGNPNQFSYGADGLTLTSYRADGFSNVGILQPTWGSGLSQGYGLYSITASHPANQGTGIAILLWPSNNGWPGPEMDMVENWNDPTSQTAYFSVHSKSPLDGSDMVHTIQYAVDLTHANTFSLDWEQGSLTYFVNGQELFHLTGSEVPADFAHGGINAAFGAQITDIGNNYEPSDRVSLTIHDMSYSVVGPAPASIRVSNPGVIDQTTPGIQHVTQTITGVSLSSPTVYAMVLSRDNVAYVGWQPVTLNTNGVGTFTSEFHATGDYLAVTTDPNNQQINGWSPPVTLGLAADPAGILSEAVAHDHLWFERSGNDLVVDVLGTTQHTYISNWYANGQPWQQIQTIDGFKLDGGIDSLVQSMASFAAAHPAFNPSTTSHTSVTDSYFGSPLATAVSSTWHF
jgi:hypothetical protein